MKITRRQALRGLAGLVTGAGLTAGLAGYAGESASEFKISNQTQYDFDDFASALGNKYDSLPEKTKKKTRKTWNELGIRGDIQTNLVRAYSEPGKVYQELPKQEKKEFDEYFAEQNPEKRFRLRVQRLEKELGFKINDFLDKKRIKEILEQSKKDYQTAYPWGINSEKPDDAEKILIWFYNKEEDEDKIRKYKETTKDKKNKKT